MLVRCGQRVMVDKFHVLRVATVNDLADGSISLFELGLVVAVEDNVELLSAGGAPVKYRHRKSRESRRQQPSRREHAVPTIYPCFPGFTAWLERLSQ